MFSAATKSGSAATAAPEDPYFYTVPLLLSGDGTNGAQNNTFLDSGPNTVSITRNGNTTQGSYSPYGSNWSNYFSGASDNIKATSISAFGIGTGNFTVEMFVCISSWSGNQRFFIQGQSGADGISIGRPNSNDLAIDIANTRIITYGWTPAVGQWYHIALVRSGTGSNQTALYINGTSVATGTSSGSVSQYNAFVGGLDWASGYNVQGYISNARYSNTARTITVPTVPYSSDANTLLLTCQSNRFIDNSSYANTITANGTPSVQRFSPFNPTAAYSTATIGGSGYFDGSGDYLTASYNTSNFDWYTSGTDYTIEAWIMVTGAGWQSGGAPATIGNMDAGGASNYWSFGINGSREPTFYYYNGSTQTKTFTGTVIPFNAWCHIAMCKTSSGIQLFCNGVGSSVTAISGTPQSGTGFPLTVGQFNGAGCLGYIGDVRIVKGTAIYSGSTYTVPTAPLTAVTNTKLLLSTTNAGIYDNAMMNDLETVGGAQVSTSVKKYGTGSMYFDGSGDFCVTPSNPSFDFGSGNFTIECWAYPTAWNAVAAGIFSKRTGVVSANQIGLEFSGVAGAIRFAYNNGGSEVGLTGSAGTLNTWQHIAVVRNGSTLTIYKDGTSIATATISVSITANTANFAIGAVAADGSYPLTGYIDDLRITKGLARYTSNFTAPTAALPTY